MIQYIFGGIHMIQLPVKERKRIKKERMRTMENKLNEKQLSFYSQIPDTCKMTYLKAVTTNSKATSIKAKCLDCCCWQKNEIKLCPVEQCPLWKYRPYQDG